MTIKIAVFGYHRQPFWGGLLSPVFDYETNRAEHLAIVAPIRNYARHPPSSLRSDEPEQVRQGELRLHRLLHDDVIGSSST